MCRTLLLWRLAFVALACLALAGCITVNASLGGSPNAKLQETTVSGEGSAKILWLPINGFISAQPSSHALGLTHHASTLTRVTRALDKAEKDDQIAAVVLRIDSPGGTVAASDEIYHRIKRFEDDTGVPVVASLGGVAASGAFYVAMSADRVIAEPTTITGSIGVIIVDVSAAGLMRRIGLANNTVKSGPHKDSLSPLRDLTAEDREILQGVVNGLFQHFVSVVKANRPHLDESRIAVITDGRIFTAPQAKSLGLVDAIGYRDDVLAAARRAAGVKQARIIRYYQGHIAPDTLTAVPGAAADLPSPATLAGWLAAMGASGAHADLQPLYLWRGRGH